MAGLQNKKASGFALVIIIVFILITIGSAIVYFYKARDKYETASSTNSTINYPLRIKTEADYELSFTLMDSDKNYLDSGTLKQGVIELYNKAEKNKTYTLHVTGKHHYYQSKECRQINEKDICIIDPIKIATPKVTFKSSEISIDAGDEGVLQQVLICSSWKYPVLAVLFTDLAVEDIPNRLKHKIDRCYNLGNVQEEITVSMDIRKAERGEDEITFYLIDKDVDEDFIQSYEVDSGLPDYEITVIV